MMIIWKEAQVQEAIDFYHEQFSLVLEDLMSLPSEKPLLVERCCAFNQKREAIALHYQKLSAVSHSGISGDS
ncbi:hypothetical protein [Fictibacillus solisalsi]|uniref:hypothetical protein n=1 Tax=Fictibacillus solisalsi TaxID=459525 RepID=UPI001113CA92|nr:hypothetical protein [Fictibacillus solisalsi]